MMSLAISSPAVCSFAQRTSVAKLQVQQEDVAQKLGEDMYNRETPPTFRLAGGSLTPAFQIWCFALQKSFAETFSLFEARSDSNRGTPPEKMQKWSATSAEEVLPHPCVAVARVWGSVGSSWDQLETLKSTQGKFGSPWKSWPRMCIAAWLFRKKTQKRNVAHPRSFALHRLRPCTLAQFYKYLTIPTTDWVCQCTEYLGDGGCMYAVCPIILIRGSIEVDEICQYRSFQGWLVKASIKLAFKRSTVTAPMC